jgi:hypothetical protein
VVAEKASVLGTNSKQSRDQSDPKKKYTTVTIYDDNKAPFGLVDVRTDINLNADGWPIRQSGHVDLGLYYCQGVFAKNIGGVVSFPKGNGYRKYTRLRSLNALDSSAN